MAPGVNAGAKLGISGPVGKGKIPHHTQGLASALLLLDVFDHLSHVVLVLAKLGSVLEEFFILLFGFFDRYGFLFLLDDLGIFGFDIGVELVGTDRLELLLDSRGRACTSRSEEGLRVIWRAAFRANHRFA